MQLEKQKVTFLLDVRDATLKNYISTLHVLLLGSGTKSGFQLNGGRSITMQISFHKNPN